MWIVWTCVQTFLIENPYELKTNGECASKIYVYSFMSCTCNVLLLTLIVIFNIFLPCFREKIHLNINLHGIYNQIVCLAPSWVWASHLGTDHSPREVAGELWI